MRGENAVEVLASVRLMAFSLPLSIEPRRGHGHKRKLRMPDERTSHPASMVQVEVQDRLPSVTESARKGRTLYGEG